MLFRVGLGIFIAMLLTVPALALSENFAVYPLERELNSCSCDLRQQTLRVQNTGEVEGIYQLVTTGSAAQWLTTGGETFSLKAGETKEVHQFLHIPCTVQGEYDIHTTVESQYGSQKTTQQMVTVQQCAGLDVVPVTDATQKSCPCTPVAFNFEVQNKGNGPENYRIWIDPSEYVSLTHARLRLLPGEKRMVTAYVHTPCEIYGEQEFIFNIRAERAGLKGTHPFSLNVNACYEYGIGINNQYDLCQNVLNSIPITVTNNAEFQNTYEIEIEGIHWGAAEQSVIPVAPKETVPVKILLDPQQTAAGLYPITVNAVSERGELMQSTPVALNLEACYQTQITPESVYPAVIACEQTSFSMVMQNSGTRQADLVFAFSGPAFTALDQSSMILLPGEAKIVKERLNVPCAAEDFSTTFVSSFAQIPYLNQEIEVNFKVIPLAEGYALNIDAPKKIRTTYSGTSVPIILTNTGIREGTYNVGLTGPEFTAVDVQQVQIPAGSSVAVTLTVAPSADTEEGNYPLGIGAALVNTYGQVVVYEQQTTIVVNEWGLLLRVLPYVLILLLLALLALFFLRKNTAVKSEGLKKYTPFQRKRLIGDIEEGKFGKSEKPLVRALGSSFAQRLKKRFERKKSVEAEKEGEKEVKQIKQKKKIAPTFWKWLMVIVLLLLIGVGTFFTSPLLKEEKEATMPEEEALQEGVIRIGETSLTVLPGNIVIITKPSVLPLRIVNDDRITTMDISITLPGWIDVSKTQLTVTPEQEEEITLDIDPTEQSPGDHILEFNIRERGSGDSLKEEVILRIVRLTTWQKILFFVVVGLLLLALLLSFVHRKLREKPIPSLVGEKVKKSKILAAPIAFFCFKRIMPFFIPTKNVWERIKEAVRRWDWKRILAVLIPIAVILLILVLLLATPLGSKTADAAKQGYESMAEQIKAVKPAIIDLTSDELPEEIYLDESGVIIPLKVRNDDLFASYLISVKEEVEWISTDKEMLDIDPRSSEVVNIAVAPSAAVQEGKYRIMFDVSLSGDEQLFQKGIVLNYKKSLWKKIVLWLLLILLGIVLLAMILTVLKRKEIAKEHRSVSEVRV